MGNDYLNSSIETEVKYVDFTLPASGTTSGAIDISGYTVCGILTPASMTGTSLSFTMCDTVGGTYLPVVDDANASVTVTVDTTAAYRKVYPADFAGIRYIKVVSNDTEVGARACKLAIRPMA